MKLQYKDLHFSEAPKMVTELPGPKAKKILEGLKTFSPPSREGGVILTPSQIGSQFTVLEEGKGATVKDVDGNIFVDLGSGYAVVNIGHCNPVTVKALKDQAERFWHLQPFPSPHRLIFSKKLADIMPGGMRNNIYIGFATSGSEACESALKTAKNLKKKGGIIAFTGCFHGGTHGAIALTTSAEGKSGLRNLMPGVHHLPYPYCYRCPFGEEHPECGLRCVDFVERQIEDSASGIWEPAAMFIEPIQGWAGYIPPPDGFLPEMRRITEENNLLLVTDEVQCGWCRSGKTWAVEHWNVTPDILYTCKAVAAGMPGFAPVAVRKEVADVEGGRILGGGTFTANHLAMAVASANIDFLVKNKIADRAKDLGDYTIKALKDAIGEAKFIGDIRGKGLMIGIEFVKDKKTKEPAPEASRNVTIGLLKRGYIVPPCGRYYHVARIAPPITITEELIDGGVAAIGEAVREAEK